MRTPSLLVLTACLLGSGAALAQYAPPPGPPPGPPPHMTGKDRFNAANTTHDGRLTMEQAQAGMPNVARHFQEIDVDRKGYVTIQDVHAWHASMNARRTTGAPPPPPPPGGAGPDPMVGSSPPPESPR